MRIGSSASRASTSLTWLDADGPVTQRQLADHAVTDPMMTSQVLRVLEERGLIERSAHPDDKRAWSLAATKAGVRLANRANAAVEARDRDFFSVLAGVKAEFTAALRRLRS
jgi:DNA-binding MarR family transcriptional regulator